MGHRSPTGCHPTGAGTAPDLRPFKELGTPNSWQRVCFISVTVGLAELSPGLLECLDAISRLGREGRPVDLARLGRRLGLDRAATMERVAALEAQSLVRGDHAGRVVLTEDAEPVALGLLRKHRLLERLLTDRLEMPWALVHEEARRLTPGLSDEDAEALARRLSHPARCPHGNPIPAPDGAVVAERGTPLHRLPPGRSGVIVRVEREGRGLLRELANLGLLPDTKVEVEEVAPFGGPVLVRVGSCRYALGREVAAHILVREV